MSQPARDGGHGLVVLLKTQWLLDKWCEVISEGCGGESFQCLGKPNLRERRMTFG